MKVTVIYQTPVPTRGDVAKLYATRAVVGLVLGLVFVGIFGWGFGLWLLVMAYVGILGAALIVNARRKPCMYCGTSERVAPLALPGRPWPWGLRWLLPPRIEEAWVCSRDFLRWIEDYEAARRAPGP